MSFGSIALFVSFTMLQPRVIPDAPVASEAGSESCLALGTEEMDVLLPAVRRVITRVNDRADGARSGLGLTKGSSSEVVPILEEEVCAKALRILKNHLGELASISDQVAVVRVQGRYVARYRFRYPADYAQAAKLEKPNVANFYFDREFTRIHRQTW